MKRITLVACLALVTALAVPASANSHMDATAAAHMKQCAGTWDATIHMTMGPETSKAPETSKGTETVRIIGDGQWLVSDFEGNMAGAPFTGHGVTGFDPTKKKYVGVWVDSMSPHVMHMEGTMDAAGKKLTMTGEAPDHQTGKMIKHTMTETYVDADTREFVMAMPGPDGKVMDVMKIVYKRRK
jgi:uncharacterized protein DUF1579